ncbi:hypothetical protein AB1Y20_012163 [Prymnesium parvum]|uniref:Fucosyltransferase n=1 Tax=Prymnesium parvum TaxID=97485 RepID=A0AB34INL7_PRYPA
MACALLAGFAFRIRSAAERESLCMLLGSWLLVDDSMLWMSQNKLSHVQPGRAAPARVLYTEEGTYFGRAWPRTLGMSSSEHTVLCHSRGGEDIELRRIADPAYAREAVHRGDVEAHVRVVHSPDSQSLSHVRGLRTSPLDWLVHYTMESPLMWPADLHHEYMRQFNARWSYRRELSLLPSVYFPRPPLAPLLRPKYRVPWTQKLHTRLLVTAVTNCADYVGRKEYLEELQRVPRLRERYVNFGACRPVGAPGLPSRSHEGQPRSDAEVDRFVSRSFFYLALENAACDGYVTEKLSRAVSAGVVPVVFDAPPRDGRGRSVPGYSRFLPPHTYINVAHFGSPADLAAHLEATAANRTQYEAYLWPRSLSLAQLRERWPDLAEWEELTNAYRARRARSRLAWRRTFRVSHRASFATICRKAPAWPEESATAFGLR